MKKWFVLLLCMILCLPVLAAAEDAQYEWYTDPAGRFSFAYPDTWTLESRDQLESTLDEAEKLDDADYVETLESMRDEISQSDVVMITAPNQSNNINILTQDVGVSLDDDMLLELGRQLQSALSEQLEGMVFPMEPYLLNIGERNVLTAEYTYSVAGYDIYGVQTMHTRGTTLYTITLTSDPENVQTDAEVLGVVLGSLTVE